MAIYAAFSLPETPPTKATWCVNILGLIAGYGLVVYFFVETPAPTLSVLVMAVATALTAIFDMQKPIIKVLLMVLILALASVEYTAVLKDRAEAQNQILHLINATDSTETTSKSTYKVVGGFSHELEVRDSSQIGKVATDLEKKDAGKITPAGN